MKSRGIFLFKVNVVNCTIMGIVSSITGGLKKIGRGLAGLGSGLLGVISVGISTFIGIPGFILDIISGGIFGYLYPKKLRLTYFVLADEDNNPIVDDAAIQADFDLTKRIFREQSNVEVIRLGVFTALSPPANAYDIRDVAQSYADIGGVVGNYFRSMAGLPTPLSNLTVFVVNTIDGNTGRSLAPLTNYVLVEKSRFVRPVAPSTTTAHEVGHACGLGPRHRTKKENLMYPGESRGEKLDFWQDAVIRRSRFVTAG